MATFSQNQVQQLYVVSANSSTAITSGSAVGTVKPCADTAKSHLYFSYRGEGGVMRSDLIDISKIVSAKATSAVKMQRQPSARKIALNNDFLTSSAPIVGQDYILEIAFRNYIGMSENDQYFKFGMVHCASGDTASSFYIKLAKSLAVNFSREVGKVVTIYLEDNTGTAGALGALTEVTTATNVTSLTDTYVGIIIEEYPQEWVLGTFSQVPVNFELISKTITFNGDDVNWGVATDVTAKMTTAKIGNGNKAADLEYFCMGNRGDMYRMVGFPKVLNTKYQINPSLQYDFIDIQYYYSGDAECVQKSPKTITLVAPAGSAGTTHTIANAVIGAINTASGLSIATIS